MRIEIIRFPDSFPQELWQGGRPGSCSWSGGCWTAGSRRGRPSEKKAISCVTARENSASCSWRHAHCVSQWKWPCKRPCCFLTVFICCFCVPKINSSDFWFLRSTLLAAMMKAPSAGKQQARGLRWFLGRCRWMRRWCRCRQETATPLLLQKTEQFSSGARSGSVAVPDIYICVNKDTFFSWRLHVFWKRTLTTNMLIFYY